MLREKKYARELERFKRDGKEVGPGPDESLDDEPDDDDEGGANAGGAVVAPAPPPRSKDDLDLDAGAGADAPPGGEGARGQRSDSLNAQHAMELFRCVSSATARLARARGTHRASSSLSSSSPGRLETRSPFLLWLASRDRVAIVRPARTRA